MWISERVPRVGSGPSKRLLRSGARPEYKPSQEIDMKAKLKVLAIGTFSVLSALGAITASAQGIVNSEPLGQSTAANGGTAANLPDVDAGAMAVTHPTSNGEPTGQST